MAPYTMAVYSLHVPGVHRALLDVWSEKATTLVAASRFISSPLASPLGRQTMDAVPSCGGRFVSKFGSWPCGSPEKTHAGLSTHRWGVSKDSALRYRRHPRATGSGKVASDQSALV